MCCQDSDFVPALLKPKYIFFTSLRPYIMSLTLNIYVPKRNPEFAKFSFSRLFMQEKFLCSTSLQTKKSTCLLLLRVRAKNMPLPNMNSLLTLKGEGLFMIPSLGDMSVDIPNQWQVPRLLKPRMLLLSGVVATASGHGMVLSLFCEWYVHWDGFGGGKR